MDNVRIGMVLLTIIILTYLSKESKAATFDYSNGLTVEARDFRTAAKHCYKKLNPVFVTEEKALEAIDICVNGKLRK